MRTREIFSGQESIADDLLPPFSIVFGHSKVMQVVQEKMEKLAGTSVPVLIHGESGTGKEVLARALHHSSPWNDGPFVKVNCPAIPATLMESELFGYEKGAFTGAYSSKPGRVEMANYGTLFLDEIAELDPGLQAKLLQVLQDGQFLRIGGREETRVEARIVCATNRDLLQEIKAGSFRADLFYRINVINLHLPPLRERREDIPGLIDYFLASFCSTFRRTVDPPSPVLLKFMQRYDWPGNIRQLENIIKQYVIFGSEGDIASDLIAQLPCSAFSPEEAAADGSPSLKDLTHLAVQDLERKVIRNVLEAHRWNRTAAARTLKISYRALLYKIRDMGLDSEPTETHEISKKTNAVGEGHEQTES